MPHGYRSRGRGLASPISLPEQSRRGVLASDRTAYAAGPRGRSVSSWQVLPARLLCSRGLQADLPHAHLLRRWGVGGGPLRGSSVFPWLFAA